MPAGVVGPTTCWSSGNEVTEGYQISAARNTQAGASQRQPGPRQSAHRIFSPHITSAFGRSIPAPRRVHPGAHSDIRAGCCREVVVGYNSTAPEQAVGEGVTARANPISVGVEATDEELVLGCRQGSAEAWEALVGRYQRLVYSIPRRTGLDEEAAADVFGHVFATLVEHLDRLDQPSRVGAWLATTAKRESWRVSRSSRRYVAATGADGTDEGSDVPDADPLPEETLLRLEEQHRVRTAVGELDERCGRLLTLLFYHEESPAYSQIASALAVPEGSIGPTRARCLEKLRRILERSGR